MQHLVLFDNTHDIIHHLMLLVDPITAIVIGFINKKTYNVLIHHYRQKISRQSVIYMCVVNDYPALCSFFLLFGMLISEHAVTHTVWHGRFNMLNIFKQYKMINYDNLNLLLCAIESKNLKMVKFIYHQCSDSTRQSGEVYETIAMVDNVDIYYYLFNSKITIDVHILVKHCSIRILEHLRYKVIFPRKWDNLILQIANITQNQFMIDWVNSLS
ncbi:MAG TPA: hypothetical protein VLG50_08465 [Candidatus Saccharimonadales bacterium]|nr:hypothetical protein [Candidatus Saccharimonadales bacterium]